MWTGHFICFLVIHLWFMLISIAGPIEELNFTRKSCNIARNFDKTISWYLTFFLIKNRKRKDTKVKLFCPFSSGANLPAEIHVAQIIDKFVWYTDYISTECPWVLLSAWMSSSKARRHYRMCLNLIYQRCRKRSQKLNVIQPLVFCDQCGFNLYDSS